MAISSNPTKTRGIEKAWNREINKRFAAFKKSILSEFKGINRLFVNEFSIDPNLLSNYITFVQSELDRLIVGSWQEEYQRRSYQLAIQRLSAELERIVPVTTSPSQLLAIVPSTISPVHQEALGFLYTRSFEALSGLSQEMTRTMRNILFNGAQEGKGIAELTREITNRIGVGRSRARLIAQTETIQAYQRGTINQADVASDFLDEEIKMRWLTRRDNKVRHLHARWHGRIFSREDAFKNINISPWNCRCGLSPVIKESDTEAKRQKFDRERKELRELGEP